MQESTLQSKQGFSHFNCDICKDTEVTKITKDGYDLFKKCKCKIMKEVKQRMNNSGLADLLDSRTFESYTTDKPFQVAAKSLAIEYVKEFLEGNKWSFAFLGQSGIGKSHLMIAVSRKLLEAGINVKHYTADEITQTLQACKYDEQNYNLEFGKIANSGVLFIDDLFKSSITKYYNQEAIKHDDLEQMFKIINYRYNKKLPIIVTSEIHFERFTELDQAIIGRINEMCNYKYLVSVKPDPSKNYRLTRR